VLVAHAYGSAPGKSSLLNVLLGEEDILPTNGMRASTGCPIEVAYTPSSAYCAEIEFMTQVSCVSGDKQE
jgi:hypothetical protein